MEGTNSRAFFSILVIAYLWLLDQARCRELGVQEGVAAVTLKVLGYAAAEGVCLPIIRKIRTVFWKAMGLLLVARYLIARPAEEGGTTWR